MQSKLVNLRYIFDRNFNICSSFALIRLNIVFQLNLVYFLQYFHCLLRKNNHFFLIQQIADVQRCIELLDKLQSSGEVPATKLAALQKVLQSDFLNAVREVYEHVYETVDIQGSQDVRASATAKATVAAFAASEGHGKCISHLIPFIRISIFVSFFY